jgi:hypothetical protein
MVTFGILRWNKRAFFGGILLFGLLAMTARSATDPDLWWHLRTGQWIVETGHVPHSDPFSFTRAGHAWVSHEWLSEVIFYELWKHAGAASLIIFSAAVTTLGFILLYRRCLTSGRAPVWAAAATVLGALAAAPCFGVRPQMFTFTLASLLLWLLDRGENRPRLLLWIPPLFLLWLNLHAGFALGPVLLFAYGIGLTLETAFGSTPWPQAWPLLSRVFLLLLACLALVPLNPSGAHLYVYPLHTLLSSGMRSFIAEWHSPNFHDGLYRPLLIVWLLLLTAVASARSRPNGRVLVPLIFTAFAALDALRHIPIFILIAIPVIAAALPRDAITPLQRRASSRRQLLFGTIVLLLMAILTSAKWIKLARTQAASEARQYPQQAISFLRATGFPNRDLLPNDDAKRIFVFYDWGGYAIWKLYPEYLVFADGRADLYGDEILRQFRNAVELHTGWREILNNWKINTVLVPPSTALAQALLLDPNWHIARRDSEAILFLRTDPGTEKKALSAVLASEVQKR